MYRLILNDWIAGRKGLMWAFLLMNLALMFDFSVHNAFGLRDVGLDLILFLPSGIFYMAERSKSSVVFRSLPIAQSEIVLARYLSVWILMIGATLYAVVFRILALISFSKIYFTALQKLGFYTVLDPTFFWLVTATVTYAIIFPILFRFGTLIIPILIAVWFVIYSPLQVLADFTIRSGLASHAAIWIPSFTIFFLVLLVGSYCISLRWFSRREF